MKTVTLKLEKELMKQVKFHARKKYPLRNIDKYAKAAREVLIEFVNENKNQE